MRNLRLLLEYDGTEFSGWQFQPGLRTVQGSIEDALAPVLGERVRVKGSGRTDSGCHARGQVANFRTASEVSCERLLRSLSGLLPSDVAVHEVREAAEDFDSRRGARERHYSYRLLARPSPLWRRYAWYPGFDPQLDILQAAVRPLRGDHDLRGFAGSDPDRVGDPGRCIVHAAEWRPWEGGLALHISANRFLYHMVRNIVGTAVKIARGYMELERIELIMKSADRRNAGPTAPPQGVCLERVIYVDEETASSRSGADWESVRSGGILP
jgi:tRNA pseudouridine38-40 synthase